MGAVSELALCLSSGYPVSAGCDMATISLSECRRIIRESRESTGFKFPEPWAAYLYRSDWLSCADFETGSVDFRGWCGLWVLDHSDLSSLHRLFPDLRDPAITCCVMVESGDGSMRVWTETRAVELVEADLTAQYCESSYCAVCGGNVNPDDSLEWKDETVCHGCATECCHCGDVVLISSCALVETDGDTGERGYLCRDCLSNEIE